MSNFACKINSYVGVWHATFNLKTEARLTMPSAVNLGSLEFTSLVPTWIIIFSGSFVRMDLIKSSMSSVVALRNGLRPPCWF